MSATSNSLKRLQYRAFGRLVLQRMGELNSLVIECMEALEEKEEEPAADTSFAAFVRSMEEYVEPPLSPVILPIHPEVQQPTVMTSTSLSPVREEEGDVVIVYDTPLFYGDDGEDDDETLGSQDTYSVATDPERGDEYDFNDTFIDDSELHLE